MGDNEQKKCDSRIWCAACERSNYITLGDKYLCANCGKVMESDHEMHHEIFPHIVGDDDNLY